MSLAKLKATYDGLNISGSVQDRCLTDRVWYEEGRRAAHTYNTRDKPPCSLADKAWHAFAGQQRIFFAAGRLGLQVQRAIAPFPLPSMQGGLALCSLTAPYFGASRYLPRVHLQQGPLANRALVAFGKGLTQGGLALLFACQTEFFLGRGQTKETSLGPTKPAQPHKLYGSVWKGLVQQLLASPHGTDEQSHDGFMGRVLEVPATAMADRAEQRGHRSTAVVWQGLACCLRMAMLVPRLISCGVVLIYAVLCGLIGVLTHNALSFACTILPLWPWPLGLLAQGSKSALEAADGLISSLVAPDVAAQQGPKTPGLPPPEGGVANQLTAGGLDSPWSGSPGVRHDQARLAAKKSEKRLARHKSEPDLSGKKRPSGHEALQAMSHGIFFLSPMSQSPRLGTPVSEGGSFSSRSRSGSALQNTIHRKDLNRLVAMMPLTPSIEHSALMLRRKRSQSMTSGALVAHPNSSPTKRSPLVNELTASSYTQDDDSDDQLP